MYFNLAYRRFFRLGLEGAVPDRSTFSKNRHASVDCAATVVAAVLIDAPRAELPELMLADAALVQALGWDYLMGLLATGLRRRDLRKHGDELRLACHCAVTVSAVDILLMATDLAGRVARLHAVAPKLRAKKAADAVAVFVTCDTVAPAVLPYPDRAARRLCDLLVDLRAVRELTGRETFRL